MKVTKKALLDSIEKALEADARKQARWAEAVEWWKKRQLEVWLRDKQPQWRQLRDTITKALKDGKPITTDMVEAALVRSNGYRSSYISDHTYTPDKDPSSPIVMGGERIYRADFPERADMLGLRAFLENSPDDEFSLTSLQRLGFKAPSYVFRAAANATG